MRRLACILILICFLISTICPPEADFSLVSQLPALYRHSKTTEDADMNFIDFITDHLINTAGVFDKNLPGNGQKPHHSFRFHNLQHDNNFISASLQLNIAEPVFLINGLKPLKSNCYHSVYMVYIFHPPDAT